MGKKLVYYIDNRSIKISFILYALISLVVGITITIIHPVEVRNGLYDIERGRRKMGRDIS